jgi:tetratricopeptide (TPR) repeat protein
MTDNHPFRIPSDLQANQADSHAQFRRPAPEEAPQNPPADSAEDCSAAGISVSPLSVVPAPLGPKEYMPPTPAKDLPRPTPRVPLPEPELRQAEKRPSQNRRKAIIFTALAAVLVLGTLLADRYIMPVLHYREAMSQMGEGHYDRALSLFSTMEDYRDSKTRIAQCRDEKARSLMCEGNYQDALDYLEAEVSDSPMIADCIYALGVIAYNNNDPKTGLEYTQQLRSRFPDYDKTEELEQYCNYTLGALRAARADGLDDPFTQITYYDDARNYFANAGSYADAQAQCRECTYRLAVAYEANEEYSLAVFWFAELENHRDSARRQLDCMYLFSVQKFPEMNDTIKSYLDILVEAQYPGAKELQDELDRLHSDSSFELVYGEAGEPLPDVVTDLSQVYIRYDVPPLPAEWAPAVCYSLVLPTGERYGVSTNYKGGAPGTERLIDLFFLLTEGASSGTMTLEISFSGEINAIPLTSLSFQYHAARDIALPEQLENRGE